MANKNQIIIGAGQDTARPAPKISRAWAMPSPLTFTVKPIGEFVSRWIKPVSVDCFARDCRMADITNDLNPATSAMYHMDVLDFVDWLKTEGIRPACVLFDPPYSPRQAADCYQAAGVDPKTLEAVKRRKGNAWQRTKNWKEERDAIASAQSGGDVVLSFGWDSCGMGKKRGYEIVEVLLVCHGACHNDTICVAERKTPVLGEDSPALDTMEICHTAPNSRVTQCPTCGGDCTIGGDDKEGTHYYIPCRGAQS